MNYSENTKNNNSGCPFSSDIAHKWDLETSAADLHIKNEQGKDAAELAKEAWRNSVRCIGRLHWKSLKVNDARSLNTSDEIYEALLHHIETATNGGAIRPTTVSYTHLTLPTILPV